MTFYVYMLRCADGSYYVGHTENLEVRFAQHQAGLGSYTAKRRPVSLVYCTTFSSRQEAFDSERRIKGWCRAKKEALISEDWSEIRRLAKRRGGGAI